MTTGHESQAITFKESVVLTTAKKLRVHLTISGDLDPFHGLFGVKGDGKLLKEVFLFNVQEEEKK